MPSTPILRFRTTGKIARELKEPVRRIEYVLATRPHIRPVALAGNVRLFDREAVAQIRHELNAIDARKADSREGAADA